MKKLLCTAAFVTAFASAAMPASAIEFTVAPSLAPNVYGNLGDFDTWNSNATYAMLNNLSSYGTPGTPGYFQTTPNIDAHDLVVTNYKSWDGEVNPSGAYANQHGTRGHFVFLLNGQGQEVSIDGLSFVGTSTDTYNGNPYNGLGFTFGEGAFNYSQYYQGVQFGSDGMLGGGDDVFITSGLSSQKVNMIVGRGPGNAWDGSCGVPNFPPCANDTERQASLNSAGTWMGHDYQFKGEFAYENVTGEGIFNVAVISAVPEPATWAMMITGFGLAGTAIRGGKRRKTLLAA